MSFFKFLTLHSCNNEVTCQQCLQTSKLFFDSAQFGCFYVTKTYFLKFTNTNELTTESVSNFFQKINLKEFGTEYFFLSDDNLIYIITQIELILNDKNFINCNVLIFDDNNSQYIMKNYFLLLLFCLEKFQLKIASNNMDHIMNHFDAIVNYYFESKDIFLVFFYVFAYKNKKKK